MKAVVSPIRCLLVLAILVPTSAAAEKRPFTEDKFEKGELRYINDLPVLIVAGSPEEMGRQKGALTGMVIPKIEEYPKRLMHYADTDPDREKKLRAMAEALVPQIPAEHRAEIRAFAQQTKLEHQWDLGVLGNVMVDIYRGGFACSSIIVDAEHSTTHGPLFGRNLDFYTLGLIDDYNLVTVHRPTGKHAFATIGFPGLFGCVSGMNDAGLALAVHEVWMSRDKASMFNPKGVPYTFCFRRILEECATVEEAEKLLRATERTTLLNLAVCDRKDAAVFEMTPKTLAVRHGEGGLCLCTNHFRTDDLATIKWCFRYNTLARSYKQLPMSVKDVAERLHLVNMNKMTVQSMIFEPDPLILNLSIAPPPATSQPMKKLELQPLFKPEERE
jgi:isopenicillin-N N-acyltransferase like protein